MKCIILTYIKASLVTLAMMSWSGYANMTKSVTFPLTFEQYNIPYTTFIINGEPIHIQIDTGSQSGLHLESAQLKKLTGLKKIHNYRSTDVAGKYQQNTAYLAKSLDLNGMTFNNVTVVPFKPWGMVFSGEGAPPAGPVAGLGIYKNKQLLLDYAAKSLTISDDVDASSLVKHGFQEYLFQMTPDGLAFDVEQEGHHYRFILDTGATVSVIWRERLKTYKPASCLSVDSEMDNEGCEATLMEMKPKSGNPVSVAAVVVAGKFPHMGKVDGLLGNTFLKDREVYIDFKNNKVFISDNVIGLSARGKI